mgnify:CR=1 FL=1|jgi:hypothetical protein|tara:strand:+ start:92 stop:469 length:378 start_codon:yes stop_codon:yes gene_type:complete
MTEEILEVDEEKLVYRIEYIKQKLLQISTALRGKIPPDLTDQDLTEDNVFKQWVIVNSIYDAANCDESNESFNRMLYYMFDKSKGNIARLVNNYDINIKLNDAGQLEDMQLVVLETETAEEPNDE